MNVNEIITLFRRQSEESAYTHDSDMPDSISLWSNYQLIEYLNEGQEEFAERTYCFKDGSNFSIPVVSGTAEYSASGEILKIERAELLSTNTIINTVTMEEFSQTTYYDDYYRRRVASWEEQTGTPQCIITDIDYLTYRLYPIPVEDDTLKLTVRRLPLNRLTSLTDSLEIPERYQYSLLYKLQKEAYSAPKALLMGFGDALMVAERRWEEALKNAVSKIRIKTRGPGKVRYGGL